MYSHPGEYVTDFCIVRRDGLFHLFHIRGERWTWPLGYKELDLGHAVSRDLRVWEPLAPVVPVGPAGAWDENGVWAPDVIEAGGTYYLYYTGSDVRNNQAIGLATSPDLLTWTKHPANPVVTPGPWSDREVGRNVAGRDGMVFHDAPRQRYLMYYTATMADGRACLALAESKDLVAWQDLGPTLVEEDRSYNRLESAYLVAHGGRYYLFYSAKGGPNSKGHAPEKFAHFDIVYVVSDDLVAGWVKPPNHELLAGWMCASEHPTFDGVTYMFYVVQEEVEGVWGASVLSDPKRLEWMADGTVRILEQLPENVTRQPIFVGAANGNWVEHGGAWRVEAEGVVRAPGAGEAWLMNPLWGADGVFEADVRTDGRASLVARGNPSAMAGYRIGIDVGRQVIGFYRRVPGQAEVVIQERQVALAVGKWHKLKVAAQGKFFDVYVDDTLMIVRDERTYTEGCWGLHAAGPAEFRGVAAYVDVGPETGIEEWTRACLPRHLG